MYIKSLVQQHPNKHWHKIHPCWYARTDISNPSDYYGTQQQQQQHKLFIYHCYYTMRKNKSSLAVISKQKEKLSPGLDNTPGCLGAVIDRQWVLSRGGKESIPVFFIGKRNER